MIIYFSYAVPTRNAHITTFKPQSTKVVHEYDLNTYERVIQASLTNSDIITPDILNPPKLELKNLILLKYNKH